MTYYFTENQRFFINIFNDLLFFVHIFNDLLFFVNIFNDLLFFVDIFNDLLFYRESEDGVDLTLFEALREGIYSEVATLISQNENRPHFLIELFRELQKLNTDYLRQRALYAIRDVGSKFLAEASNDVSVAAVSFEVN
jgi:hypothetical protein